jgi:hypothetical protein
MESINKERMDKMIKVTGKSREATNQYGVGFANSPKIDLVILSSGD